MRENWKICIRTQNLLLLPYRRSFVPIYHTWMSDPALLEATSSERLTLDEEYTAQRGWVDDPEKCTFIIFDRLLHENVAPRGLKGEIHVGDGCNTAGMCGDVNLFLLPAFAVEDYFAGVPCEGGCAEVMVMIADVLFRRRGYASEAVRGLLTYGVRELNLKRFVVKISENNIASLSLFQDKLGFVEVKRVPAFSEVHLAWEASELEGGEVDLMACDAPLKEEEGLE